MTGILKIKWMALVVLVTLPGSILWKVQAGSPAMAEEAAVAQSSGAPPAGSPPETLQVPVEVVSHGSAPEWVYVKVESHSVPEPGFLPLLLVTGLVLLKRRRG